MCEWNLDDLSSYIMGVNAMRSGKKKGNSFSDKDRGSLFR